MCNQIKTLISQQRQGPLSIGEYLPSFCKKAVRSAGKGMEFFQIDHQYGSGRGKWTILFWWPKDFTFVCPTEIMAFDAQHQAFTARNTVLIGASTDSEFVHLAWRQHHPGLRELTFPLLADTSKSLATQLGILDHTEKVAYRATFIIDPGGVVRWVSLYDMAVGRNVEEVLRVLDALQTGELTPCGWKAGDATLTVQQN